MRKRVLTLIRGSLWATCFAYIANGLKNNLLYRLGRIATDSGTLHGELDIAASAQYIHRVYDSYCHYAGTRTWQGRAAEIGPGDNCGVGLLFLANGCSSADLVDRFYSRRDPARQGRVYAALAAQDPGIAALLEGARVEDEATFPGIHRHYGPEAAAETYFRTPSTYDVIYSTAVLEHLDDPILAVRAMAGALKPGGRMLHKVDLRDHGMFSSVQHELKFMEVPDRVYRWMTRGTGRPNRIPISAYRKAVEALGLEARFLVTGLAGIGDVEPHLEFHQIPEELRQTSLRFVERHRPRFAKSLAALPSEDLSITGFFLVATRA